MFYGQDVLLVPSADAGWISSHFNLATGHKGIDIAWTKSEWKNCDVLAPQDGKVIFVGYSSEVGHNVVMEHTYASGKRYTACIHMAQKPTVKVGEYKQMGDPIGIKGNTGISHGEHVHMYMTKILPFNTVYGWNMLLNNVIDPYPYLYVSPKYNYLYIDREYWKKELVEVKYPEPVKRNEAVHQCEVKSATRNMRKSPNGELYTGVQLTPGIYNVYEEQKAGAYNWALIDTVDGNKFWIAVMQGEDLPVTDYKTLYENEKKKNESLKAEYETLKHDYAVLEDKFARMKKIFEE